MMLDYEDAYALLSSLANKEEITVGITCLLLLLNNRP